MASRNFSDLQALNRHVKVIAGRLQADDTAVQGLGWSGANTDTGEYTITLDDQYNALLAFLPSVQSTAGTDDYVVSIVSEDVDGAKTIVLNTAVDGTLTDLGSGDQLHFAAFLQNSSVPSV